MCGVFGVIRPSGVTVADHKAFLRLGNHLRHRGPDGSGYAHGSTWLIGMHRLSIMDIDSGSQPFESEDGSVVVFGNGEVYNAAQIRARQRANGHRLRSTSDIEVIAHAWEEGGLESLSGLHGMFALAVIDKRDGAIWLVRDRMGEKPLVLFQSEDALWFSSEQSALVRAGIAPVRLDHRVVTSFLVDGIIPEPYSAVEGITKLEAATALRVPLDGGDFLRHQYWNSLWFAGDQSIDVDELDAAVTDAIRNTCISDVPVAVALSGGVDSSLVAAIAARERPELLAISVGYPEHSESDESGYAEALARHLNIEFHRAEITARDAAFHFSRVCQNRDEPIGDLAGLGYDAISAASRLLGFPVLLTGQGGDELFWGYPYIAYWVQSYLRSLETHGRLPKRRIRRPVGRSRLALADWVESWAGLRTHRLPWEGERIAQRNEQVYLPLMEMQLGYHSNERAVRKLGLDNASLLRTGPLVTSTNAHLAPAAMAEALSATYLRVNGLAQLDRLAMAHSVEGRTPFVDHRLVETAYGSILNPDSLVVQKSVLRDVARRHLPTQVTDRPKSGFTPPFRAWLPKIWREPGFDDLAPLLAEALSLNPRVLHAQLKSPLSGAGRVNHIALRLAVLGYWVKGLN